MARNIHVGSGHGGDLSVRQGCRPEPVSPPPLPLRRRAKRFARARFARTRSTVRAHRSACSLPHSVERSLRSRRLGAPASGLAPVSPAADVYIHPSSRSLVETEDIGAGTKIWSNARILKGARIGRDCVVGTN